MREGRARDSEPGDNDIRDLNSPGLDQNEPDRVRQANAEAAAAAIAAENAVITQQLELEARRSELNAARLRRAREEAEIRRLEAITPAVASIEATALGGGLSNALPKDKESPTFEGANRAQYDDWVRALERQFRRYPRMNNSEQLKLDQAETYIGHLQNDHWDRWKRAKEAKPVHSEPTWANMKQCMLDTMGTGPERRQKAHDRLKHIHQGQRSPTELLEEMKQLWAEIEEDRDTQMVHSFTAALNPALRLHVLSQGTEAQTLAAREEQANLAYRLLPRSHAEPSASRTSASRKRQGTTSYGRRSPGQSGPDRDEKPLDDSRQRPKRAGSPRRCYKCNQVGHLQKECTNKHLWDGQGNANPASKTSSS
nr:hypothetical protein B0A51_17500 [Rachicladosporium sp. CCFEE 5018]